MAGISGWKNYFKSPFNLVIVSLLSQAPDIEVLCNSDVTATDCALACNRSPFPKGEEKKIDSVTILKRVQDMVQSDMKREILRSLLSLRMTRNGFPINTFGDDGRKMRF